MDNRISGGIVILGIGVDIIEVKRIKAIIAKHGNKFIKRIFTAQEQANAPKLAAQQVAYYAKRFAAKEAFAKALGGGIGEAIAFTDIEILKDSKGKPIITHPISKVQRYHISLADTQENAIAYVIIEQL